MSTTFKAPKGLEQATTAALTNGWHFMVKHQRDTGDSPYVSFDARREGSKPITLVWHTRGTGSYRLFTCMAGANNAARDITLTKALEILDGAA